MAQCTAPIEGHRTASGRANCPVCGGNSYGFSSYYPRNNTPSYGSSPYRSSKPQTGRSSRGSRPRWSPSSSTVIYTAPEVRALSPVRESIEKQGHQPEKYDIFLCHAWDDRRGTAKDLNDALENAGVSVWFSEKEVLLGSNLMCEIDKGLSKSRAGLVLVTKSFIKRIKSAGVSEKELSALLARDLLVPIVHGVTYEDLREESPLLASRSGLDTADDTLEEIAAKISELVSTDAFSD
ncbi:toll/interleukin-1 receptor domain-containing protein [uncultured Varibaculum sp.]|uniref:toll/interleukin-1 receptor domain-containing protein n=1 Tax=uncultured Varibaculum sp. TaxID=413896 RepID=UPI00338D3730